MDISIYMLLTPALWYLGSRARISRFIWSRYNSNLNEFMDCPACVGAWWGLLLALTIGRAYDVSFFGMPSTGGLTPIVVGLSMIFWTPLGAGLMQAGFDRAGSAIAVCACPADDHIERGRHHDPGCAMYSLEGSDQ